MTKVTHVRQPTRGGRRLFWTNVVVSGLAAGAIYALYGLGITLIYKSTRVPNFAHGAIGAVGAYVFYKSWDVARPKLHVAALHFQLPFTHLSWNPRLPALPLVGALLLALVVTALLGVLVDRLFMRHLVGAPTISLIVATAGLLILITDLSIDIFNEFEETVPTVVPQGFHNAGGIRFTNDDVVIALVAIGIAIAATLFFRYTNLGIAIRATADSRETSRLLGINAGAVSSFAWAVGSMMSGVAGILIVSRLSGQLSFITLLALILPGFTASMFGGFTSLIGTFLGGLALGVVQNLFTSYHWPRGTLSDLFSAAGAPTFVAFLVVIVVLMTRPKFIFKGVRVDEDSGVGIGRTTTGLQLEDRARRSLDRQGALHLMLADWTVGRWILAAFALAALMAVPVYAVPYWSGVLGDAVFFALIALSLVVLIGWTGQINLAPLAFAGVGAWTATVLSGTAHWPFAVVIPLTGLVAIPIAVVVGIPALRLRGFFLALATMAFAFAAEQWLFTQSWLASRNKVDPMVPNHGDLSQPAYLMGLVVAGCVFVGVRNLSRTRVSRAFRAIRDSENTAIAMGINPMRYKLLAFALSGGIAGLAGGCAAYLHTTVVAGNFTFIGSLNFLVLIVIAGLGFIAGGVITALVGWIIPALLLGHAAGVNNGPYILVAFLAIRTVIDYPNGLAGFWTRLLRPFDAGERVAWASAGDEGAPAPAAAVAEAEADERDFEAAVQSLESAHA